MKTAGGVRRDIPNTMIDDIEEKIKHLEDRAEYYKNDAPRSRQFSREQ